MSKYLKEVIGESTAPDVINNVATTDENLTVDAMFQQSTMPSLGRQIFSVIPMNGPTAAIFNIKKKANGTCSDSVSKNAEECAAPKNTWTVSGVCTDTQYTDQSSCETAVETWNDNSVCSDTQYTDQSSCESIGTWTLDPTNNFELVRSDVVAEDRDSIPSTLTREVVDDLRMQFGKEADSVVGNLLRGLSNEQENQATFEFLESNAKHESDLKLSDSSNAETNLFEITQRVHELILKINSKNIRSYMAFAVIPYQPLGGVFGLSNYVGGDDKEGKGLFITKAGLTKFYISPFATTGETSNMVYVGLKDMMNPSKSSAVFSPYRSTVVNTTNPENGENVYHIFNRFGITLSPLNELGNELMYKFKIIV
jgi:hypothetical protein